MTKRGYGLLQEEMKHLKSVERPAVINALEEARTHGDLAENAEYHAAKERQAFIEGRLMELEDKISRAQVIDPTTMKGKHRPFWRDRNARRRGHGQGKHLSDRR